MKRLSFLLVIFCLFIFNICSAKGGSGGGHGGHSGGHSGGHGGHGGHGYGGHIAHIYRGGHLYHSVYIPQIVDADDEDEFLQLRTLIMNGYVVYKKDTLDGIITCSDNIISIKPGPQDSTYMFSIKDSNLQSVYISDEGQSIFMTRLPDKKLYRLMHSGKLSIYDTYFSFDYNSRNFFNVTSMVAYAGHTEKLSGKMTMDVKKKLVEYINTVYNTNLNSENYNRDKLLAYIQTLD